MNNERVNPIFQPLLNSLNPQPMNPNKPDADKAAEEYAIGQIVPYINTAKKIVWAEITSFKTIERNNKIWFYGIDTKTKSAVFYPVHLSQNYFAAIKEFASSQSGKERAALEKYGQHLSTCNINQDWSEAYDAMANTETRFRDKGYFDALEEMEVKIKKCTCGFEQAISGKQEHQEKLWEKLIEVLSNSLSEELMSINDIAEAKKMFSITTK